MIKKLFLLVNILFLTACTSPLTSSDATEIKALGEKWSVVLPEGWSQLTPTDGAIFMAQKQDQNFVILPRTASPNDLKKQILTSAERDFFYFKLENENSTQWSFTGQVRANLATRFFEQKFYSINSNILLGSCSYEISKTQDSDCAAILKSWSKVVEE